MTSFSEFQMDALREVGNIGAGNAATSLSQMIGKPVGLSVTQVRVLNAGDIAGYLGGIEKNVAAVHMPIYGDLGGVALVFFPMERLSELTEMVVGRSEGDADHLSELGRSAVKELGSILAGSYLNALYGFCRLQVIHGVPELAIDMAQAVLDTVIVELGEKEETAIVIETRMTEGLKDLTGSFFLLPEEGGLPRLFSAVTAALGAPGNA